VLAAHAFLGLLVIGVPAVTAVWAAVVYRRGREPRPLLRHLIALSQTLLIAQVALGLLLLSDEQRAGDDLHYAYGTLALAAVLSPWLYAPADPRRRLLWFAGATLLGAALAVRAYLTGG
jgi:hypothetical protein